MSQTRKPPAVSAILKENAKLRRRLAETQARLAEAEETLHAIRSGEVDALLVEGPKGDRVFTLEGAETPYRFLVEEMNEGALLLGPEGTILHANARFAQLARVPLQQVIGSSFERFFVPAERGRLKALLGVAVAGSVREELHLEAEKSLPRPVGVSLCSMQREQVHGFSVVVTDLTERKAAEAALREVNEKLELRVQQRTSQLTLANELLVAEMGERKRTEEELRQQREWLRVTLSSIGDAVVACDQNGRVTFMNPVASALTGWEPDQAGGRPVTTVLRIIDERTRQPIDDIVAPVLQEQKVVGLANHAVLISKDGREIPVEDSAAPILDATGELAGAVLVFHDVTEKRRAQAELERLVAERTAKWQEMFGELQHVSYAIVHDMRGPLRAMQSFASILEQERADGPSVQSWDYVARIKTAAERMDRLITDALRYTKAVLQEVPAEPVDLHELVSELAQTYPNLQPEKAEILIEGTLPVVLGNPALLTECFSNLLGNAVKFVAQGVKPRIQLRAEPVTAAEAGIGARKSPTLRPVQANVPPQIPTPSRPRLLRPSSTSVPLIRIWIEDNGIGIPKHAQPRLFGMFERLTNEYEGTGIGLAIVRKGVERMGGRVGMESEEGKGSRFWLELPVAECNSLAHSGADDPSGRQEKS